MTDRQWQITGKILAGVIVLAILSMAAVVLVSVRRGFSARNEPGLIEQRLAHVMRRVAVPAAVRDRRNPVPLTPAVLAAGRAHWADHCATCHGNDGAGQTEIGRALYPRAPDMRSLSTQELTDGELFGIIRNGIPLSGMPAWGSGEHDDQDNWHLVHFIRHLPKLTPEEIGEMERLNPKSPSEMQEMHQEEDFLSGGSAPAPEHHHQEIP